MPYAMRAAQMSRRRLLAATAPMVLLAGCGGQGFALPSVNITLPPEIAEAVDDVKSIIAKVESVAGTVQGGIQQVTAIKDQATGIIDKIKSGAGSAVALLKDAAAVLGPLVSLVAPQYAVLAGAISTLLPLISGSRQAARTGMTPMQARAILRS